MASLMETAFPVHPVDYSGQPAAVGWQSIDWPVLDSVDEPCPQTGDDQAADQADGWSEHLEEECGRSFAAGHAQGIADGLAAGRNEVAAERAKLSAQLACMMESAAADRARFFAAVEPEVVRLALAIAARILRREAQMDPLFLLGAVRVALSQVGSSTRVRLRVPQGDAQLWTDAVALLPNRDLKIEIEPSGSMRLGDCAMETELGTADLGVRAQLGEIESALLNRTHVTESPAP